MKLEDEAQPRCVAARRVFEECADSVECSFFNPHVECINQICTCQPPNILKSKDVCMPAQVPGSAAKMVGWIVSTIIVLAILVAIVLGARKLVKQNYVDDLMGPTFHSQYWREDRPNMWENVRASLAEMRDKFRSAALGRRDIGLPGQETRVTTYAPAQRAKSHARHVHQTTVRVDVHRAQSPDEDGPDVIETLLALDESDGGPLSPTSRDVMLAQEPRHCKETSVAGLAGRRTEPVDDREATPKGAANAPRKTRVSGSNEEPKNRLSGAPASPQLLFDSESEAERIMSIVLDQLVLERKGLAQARHSAKKADGEMGAEATPVGGGQRRDEEVEVPSQKKTTLDGLQISGIVRSIYSHTLMTLRNKLLLLNAHPAEADSVDEESYGDSCKPCEDKGFAEAPTELRLTGEMPRPDKGDGEDKSKASPEWRGTCNRAVRDNGPSKNYVSAAHLGKQRPRRPGGNHSESTSEHRFPPHLVEASLLLGSPLDTVLDSCRSFIGPAEAPAAVDAYPMAQGWTYALKQGKNDGCPSESYHSFSEASRSPFCKGSRKLPAGPSLFSQSTSHCATEKKGAAIKASEKLSKAGDTLKNFMSSMYPASLAATSTKSAGCFLTAYSEVPQQSGYTMDHQELSSKSMGPKKTQRVHYYDADCAREPSQNRGRSHESVVSFAPVTHAPTNNAQPGTPGSVTKKKNILKNASSTLGPWISPKNKHDHEEERPLLLNSAEVPGQVIGIGKISGGDAAVQLAGEATEEEASQPNTTKQPKLATANSSKSEVSMHNSSPVVGLDKKPVANECSGPSSSKTPVLASTASNHHVTKSTTSPICLAGSEKGTAASPSSKSRANPDQAAQVFENLESGKETEAPEDIQATRSTPSLSRRTPEVEDALPRVAHLAKLKLPFGVHGCDGKGQWSKAVDKQLGRTQTPVIFSANETDELLEKNITGKAQTVVTATLKSTWRRTSTRKQVNPDDVINLNITETELIDCINKLVGSTVMQEKNSERKYPSFYCKQTPVSGYQLLQDTRLHDEEVSDEVTGKEELARCGGNAVLKPVVMQ